MVYSRAKHRHIFFVLLIESGKLKKKKKKEANLSTYKESTFLKLLMTQKGISDKFIETKFLLSSEKMFQSNR